MQSRMANYCPADQANIQRTQIGAMAKRVTDVVLSSLALVALSPLFALIGALVASSGGRVLFRHPRVGKDGKIFNCLKFSTMMMGATECLDEYLSYHPEAREEWDTTRKLTFDPRTTGIGRLLRRTSLDELPQLINVLKGDMSLVGPRPVTSPELAYYGDKAELYRSVRPGITGLWQISGRNDVSYDERVALDARYVREQSFWVDASILLRTPRVVLARTGAR